MKISGVKIPAGVTITAPAQESQAPAAPSGPSKFVVGAPFDDDAGGDSGSVYVYNTDGTGEVKITASDGATSDYFGNSVAMSDTKVVVGAWSDDDAGTNSGSVYVYNTDGTGEQKITASDGRSSDLFGHSVAISDTKVVVGARGDDPSGAGSGSAYVYNLDGTGELRITASDAASSDGLGYSVAINSTKIFAGARNKDGKGAVYVFNTDGTGEQKITASDGASGDLFGHSLAISDTHIVVGAFGDDDSGDRSGSVYVYNLDGTGEQKIIASDGAAINFFGMSVAITDTKVVVGAMGNDSNKGAVYVYNLDGTGEQKITASDGVAGRVGFSVAVQGDKIITGANQSVNGAGNSTGAVYVYNLDGTGEQKITASDGASGDQFGRSVAAN